GQCSDADEELVRAEARTLGVRVVVGSGNVREFAENSGESIEMAARKLRHEFFAKTARRLGCSTVVLAHHADDLVELFFLRLLRGSGGEGLAGLKWSNPSPVDRKIRLVRPLLDCSKEELLEYARTNRIPFSEDATNSSLDIPRNRVRHELVPVLR